MGNSHSQASDERPRDSSVLSSSRGSSSTNGGVLNANGGLRGHKRLAGKFASPGNRVLPQPAVEGVRLLKTTQNGHILHSGGHHQRPTYHGAQLDRHQPEQRPRSNPGRRPRRLIRLSRCPAAFRRIRTGPPSGRGSEEPGKTVFSKFKGRRVEGKSPAPTPPPPPPPPDYNSDDNVVFRPGSSYEKNRRNVDKWRLSKTEPAKTEGAGQKKTTSSNDGPAAKVEPSVLAKDFKEELLAVARRRASNGFARRVAEENGRGSKTPPACNGDLKSPKSTPKKQYYFSNFDALKLKDGPVPNGNVKKTKADKGTPKRENASLNPRSLAAIDDHSQGESKVIEYILNDSSRLQDHCFDASQDPEHYNHGNRKAENRQRNRP
ncbi:hypothetical protein MTO96_019534 [Rhipicephalus appendiculatus]